MHEKFESALSATVHTFSEWKSCTPKTLGQNKASDYPATSAESLVACNPDRDASRVEVRLLLVVLVVLLRI